MPRSISPCTHRTIRTSPARQSALDDRELAISWHHEIETVPTVLRVVDGVEVERTVGWQRPEWERVTGVTGLGDGLPVFRPGCGSMSVDPDLVDALRVRFGASVLASRRIDVADAEDDIEMMFDRGWSDGLPVVPPTEERVMRMLTGTTRAPSEVVAVVPPDLVETTVEKVAIAAVMAGCKPEYLPWVLTAVEAACTERVQHPRPARHHDAGGTGDRVQRAGHPRHRDELPAATRWDRATAPTPRSGARCNS